jgi:hypothetical protein
MKSIFAALLLLAPCAFAQAAEWVLVTSTLTYHVSHPMHHVEGVSHAARGKGICQAGQCNFLVAVPVKSFESGDSNRDLHMLQVVRGAQFPMIIARARFPEPSSDSGAIDADFSIQFAGQTVELKHVLFRETIQANHARISGTIPATLSDFKIPAPEFLMIPVKNEIPVDVNMIWSGQ